MHASHRAGSAGKRKQPTITPSCAEDAAAALHDKLVFGDLGSRHSVVRGKVVRRAFLEPDPEFKVQVAHVTLSSDEKLTIISLMALRNAFHPSGLR